MTNNQQKTPELGFGLGLRTSHYSHIFENSPKVDWFEIISENFMDTDGHPKRNLERIRENYPVAMHGVAMSVGTVDPLESEYMQKLKTLIDWLEPAWISDHLCWTGIAHRNTHDLLPVPYTEESLQHIIEKIQKVQDYLQRPIALENPSTYLEFKASTMPESEFISRMAKESGCNLLLDVNNVYVTCYNHRLDPQEYLDNLPMDKVMQIHLSGHSNNGSHIIDTHDDHVIDEVWQLYRYVIQKAERTPNTMVEWDDNIPEFDVLYAELDKAKAAAKDLESPIIMPQLKMDAVPSQITNLNTPLHDLQTQMQSSILPDDITNADAKSWIRDKKGFSPDSQLEVYINSYRYRLYGVTAEEYPILQHYLGDDEFDNLIDSFVNKALSNHFNIGRYTAMLPDFMKNQAQHDEFATEICTLEDAISQIADLKETTALTPEHLEGLTAEKLMESTLHPRAALKLFSFNYPVNQYYRAIKDEKTPPSTKPKPCYLAVFRHEDTVWRMELEELESKMLSELFSGLPIGDALESIQTEFKIEDNILAGKLSEWFAKWMRNGLLAKF